MKSLILFAALLALACSGCGDDDPTAPVTSESTTYFSLCVAESDLYRDGGLWAVFSTTNQEEVPEVRINGILIGNWMPYGMTLVGMSDEYIPYSNIVSYSIIAGGETSAGTLTLPDMPSNPRCNGLSLLKYDTVPIPEAAVYTFTWDSGAYDYLHYDFHCREGATTAARYGGSTTENTIEISPGSFDEIWFNLITVNGLMPESGVDITSDLPYGKGYICAMSAYWSGRVVMIPGGGNRHGDLFGTSISSTDQTAPVVSGAHRGFPFTPEDMARRLEEAVGSLR